MSVQLATRGGGAFVAMVERLLKPPMYFYDLQSVRERKRHYKLQQTDVDYVRDLLDDTIAWLMKGYDPEFPSLFALIMF
jgi:hypothetical protein